MYGVDNFMKGQESLDQMVNELLEESRKERLQELLDNYKLIKHDRNRCGASSNGCK